MKIKLKLKLRSYLYGIVVLGLSMTCGFEKEAGAVTKFVARLKPEQIQVQHQAIKEKLGQSVHPKEKETLKGMLLKFEKYYIMPDDYTLEVSVQDAKGEKTSLNIIGTTNENKRFSLETPCEAKGTLNGERLYIQPKLDVNKTGDLYLKISVVLGRQEFLVVMPYKNEMEVKDEQKASSGSLKINAKLKIKSKGFWK